MNTCKSCKTNKEKDQFIKNGKIKKTCKQCLNKKTEKKEILPSNQIVQMNFEEFQQFLEDELDEFESATNDNFEFYIRINLDNNTCNMTLNEISNKLCQEIEKQDGFKWRYWKTNYSQNNPQLLATCYYRCSQSIVYAEYKLSNRKRMQRYNCNGKLTIQLNLELNCGFVHLQHKCHNQPEVLNQIPDDIKDEIKNNTHLNPLQLREHLALKFNIETYTIKQIYYWWTLFTQLKYKRDNDHLKSARILLQEYQNYGCRLLLNIDDQNVRAIGFSTPLSNELKDIRELYIDATYKTTHGRFELYGLIGEVQGSGFALGYLFLETTKGKEYSKTEIIAGYLTKINEIGISPKYVFLDKDYSEINAVKNVWPNAYIQLCLWHLKRAIRKKMHSKKKSERFHSLNENDYKRFSFIDPEFFPKTSDPLEIYTLKQQEAILSLIENHFNMHTLIPTNSGRFLSANEIWDLSTKEIYDYCHKNKFAQLWNYLYLSWYSLRQYNYWARASRPDIPYGKTTMMIEGHWKVLKHDYLYRFNRPRLDFVVYIICEKLIIDQKNRLNQLLTNRINPHWWEDFKKCWKYCATAKINLEKQHFIDVDKWICSCNSFLTSRFLICKHLVQKSGKGSQRLIYDEFKRQHVPPFWKFYDKDQNNLDEICSNLIQNTDNEDHDEASYLIPEENLDISTETIEIRDISSEKMEQEINKRLKFIMHLQEEFNAGNFQHVDALLNGSKKSAVMIDDINRVQNKRLRQNTWNGSKPWTMFLQN